VRRDNRCRRDRRTRIVRRLRRCRVGNRSSRGCIVPLEHDESEGAKAYTGGSSTPNEEPASAAELVERWYASRVTSLECCSRRSQEKVITRARRGRLREGGEVVRDPRCWFRASDPSCLT
jgi:hypothetical protein